jgi:general secretion pathway protein G
MASIPLNVSPSSGRRRSRGVRAGFTLVEILIVVIILGILAAIAIPQFSNASAQSRVNSLMGQIKTLRAQIELFRIQHTDIIPDLVANQWAQLLNTTNPTGAVDATAAGIYGPYVNKTPSNPLNGNTIVAVAAGAGVGWVYDATTGQLTATNQTSTVMFDENTQTVQ